MDPRDIDAIVRRALDEDLPDITSEAIFSADDRGTARFLVKAEGVIAGLPFAEATFRAIDGSSRFGATRKDGDRVRPGDIVAEVEGTVVGLLSGERPALNLMQRASGIATATRRYVDAIAGTRAKIYDTRKTAPGLRALDKYAVLCGGGENHRTGLFDMFLIKNNHVDRAGSITAAVHRIRARNMSLPSRFERRSRAPASLIEVSGAASSAVSSYHGSVACRSTETTARSQPKFWRSTVIARRAEPRIAMIAVRGILHGVAAAVRSFFYPA